MRAAVADTQAVVNLVGIGRERGQSFEEVHLEGAARIARLAAAAGVVRLLHVSALGIAEDAPSAADRTKARGEEAVRAVFPSATIVRPSLVYGPGDHFFARFAAVARVLARAARDRRRPDAVSADARRGRGAHVPGAARAP